MRILTYFILLGALLVASSCSQEETSNFVLIKGGAFKNKMSNLYNKNVIVTDLYIGKYEVTQKEWIEVMGSNPSKFKGDNLPVEMVRWYDCVEYCNKRSLKEGLTPYYNIFKDSKDTINVCEYDSIKWTVTYNSGANGYRLPTEVEWEYAAGGGRKSKNYKYSGSDDIDKVAWYWKNSGDKILTENWLYSTIEKNNCKTHPIGSKAPNELGIFDMSGNVREWCDEWYVDQETNIGILRAQRGGGWLGAEHCCESSYRGSFEASGLGPDQGFRVCRDK